jgi:ribonuclease HI
VQAEAIAMLKAIDFVKERKQTRCTFLTDCSVIAKIASQLQPPQEEGLESFQELHEIWRAFKQNSLSSCQHIQRDQNDLADILAKKGRIHGGHFTGYTFPL